MEEDRSPFLFFSSPPFLSPPLLLPHPLLPAGQSQRSLPGWPGMGPGDRKGYHEDHGGRISVTRKEGRLFVFSSPPLTLLRVVDD